ncbi:type IV pilin protein [Streptomyces sp. NPDC059385]|uniref:type IV pilin protein n=1 Tax=Streptomyces sp. NPDC059385 TaxID=3346817 RepID=UPI003683E4D9
MFTYVQGKVRGRMRAQNTTAEAGFTLIELLVVIVILGILSAIVVFSVSGINDKGQGAACKTDLVTVQTAEEAYFATYNKYADSTAELMTKNFLATDSQWHQVAVDPVTGKLSVTPKGTTCS